MENNQEQIKKLELIEKSERELCLYYFITKFVEKSPTGENKITEGVATILSFDLDRAITQASQSLPLGTQIIIAGNKKMSEIMELIKVEEKREIEIKIPEHTITKKLSKEEFKNNILLVADTMIDNEKDKKTLKKIVSKINV